MFRVFACKKCLGPGIKCNSCTFGWGWLLLGLACSSSSLLHHTQWPINAGESVSLLRWLTWSKSQRGSGRQVSFPSFCHSFWSPPLANLPALVEPRQGFCPGLGAASVLGSPWRLEGPRGEGAL